MTEPLRCARCVLSASFPAVAFDADGVCSFCRGGAVATTRAAVEAARLKVQELFAVRTRPYDAILCNSGGKDSSYTLKLAVRRYGLRVLSFTLDNGFLSPVAHRNIRAVTDALGVDHVTVRPAFTVFREVIKATALRPVYREKTLNRISAGCNACISLVNTTALRLALEKRAPAILAGFTLGQIPANAIVFRNSQALLADSRAESLARLREAVGVDLDPYYGIDEALVASAPRYPHSVNLLCLETVTEAEILREVAELGWQQPSGLDGCSSNCELNAFNNHVHLRRFGFHPYELELSHLVRAGLMTRDEAIAKLSEQPTGNLAALGARLELTPAEADALGIPRAPAGGG